MAEPQVGLFGVTSIVGASLLSQLAAQGRKVVAFSRRACTGPAEVAEWHQIGKETVSRPSATDIPHWICAAPIWVLPQYFDMMLARGARRVVVLSSTSRFTKQDSSDLAERLTAGRLAGGEAQLQDWAERNGIEWVVLRPTLIYGYGQDKNVCEMARFIRRFGLFPVFGPAQGLRQPVHADDVATACVAALSSPAAANRAYNISGGETLTYYEMVRRVSAALGRKPRIVRVPLGVFAVATALLRLVPRCRQWTPAMAGRMNRDLVFDHADAVRDLGYAPRAFKIGAEELPWR